MKKYYMGRAYLRRMRSLYKDAAAIRAELAGMAKAKMTRVGDMAGAKPEDKWGADTGKRGRFRMLVTRLEVIGDCLNGFYTATAYLSAEDRETALAYVETKTTQEAAYRIYVSPRSFFRRMSRAAESIAKAHRRHSNGRRDSRRNNKEIRQDSRIRRRART